MIGWWVLATVFLFVSIVIYTISMFGYRSITQKKKLTTEDNSAKVV
jgi:uncharacterized protein